MPEFRQVVDRFGKVGLAFLVCVTLFLLFYLVGWNGLATLSVLLALPFGLVLGFLGLRYLKRHGLWSVRNRLLVVYGLIGVLPILFVLVLVALGAWALTNELAIYLATTALDRRLESVRGAVETLRRMPLSQQLDAAPEVVQAFRHTFPGMTVYIKDDDGLHRFPADGPELALLNGWHNLNGLLVFHNHFYGWAHVSAPSEEIAALAPFSDRMVQDLVPNLGSISLFESPDDGFDKGDAAAAGSLRETVTNTRAGEDPDFKLSFTNSAATGPGLHLPPAAFRFDIPVLWPSTISHYHLEAPNKTFHSAIWVFSRPSAVLRTFFSSPEFFRNGLFDSFAAVAFLFLLLELAAVFIGTRLARRLTGAIKALYAGTQRVIFGDFTHRIPVLAHDQLGDLAASFNQMTGNLERLLVVEKEKERLQTELEIAREVQGQLYPKEAPPTCGLKLTVRCDPARMVSGDYYDYQELGGKRLAFAIGDVAGKGISAALLMATIQAALRAQMTQYQPVLENECSHVPEIDVSHLVSALNKQIFAHTSPEKYATFFFALFDERTRTLTYTNAGHLSPLLFSGGEVIPLASNGTVVGAFPFSQYEESCLTINPGDLLVCYTDGITEPENAYGEEFGEHRLIELIEKHSARDDHEILDIILDSVRSWTSTAELHDDMTLLLARGVNPTVILEAQPA